MDGRANSGDPREAAHGEEDELLVIEEEQELRADRMADEGMLPENGTEFLMEPSRLENGARSKPSTPEKQQLQQTPPV